MRSIRHHGSAKISTRRLALIGATCLTTLVIGVAAHAQTAPASAAAQDTAVEEVIVTGYRSSLAASTNAKRDAVGFQDSIFAEDIGKFPDTNIAESFNRVPGITISREVSGEGLNIAIRGLGSNFTRVLLNGAPVAVASTGRTDAQSTGRDVDLDMFPTELFSQLSVNKSPLASLVEGGAAGTVNMRSARPFDGNGRRVSYSVQGTKGQHADKWGGRGSFIASDTWGDFGALVGVTAVRNYVNTPGFETIGWTNANLSVSTPTNPNPNAQCAGLATSCNTTGGGNWTIPGVVPANAGNNLVTGAILNQAALLALNPGLTIQQIDNALIPRLGRPAQNFGRRDRVNAIASFEWKPTDDLHVYLDSMYGKKKNDLKRIDLDWVGRNGAAIPINMKVDRSDCSNGCVVTEGTFANAQMFMTYRPFLENTTFYGANPGFDWQIGEKLKVEAQANYTKSKFHRESPSVLLITPASSGLTVTYKNDGGIPSIKSSADINDPKNFGWPGGRVNIQDERRETETKGVRGSLTWGDEHFNLKFGGAYDDVTRRITAYDNSQAWQNAICGNNPSVFLPSPNTQPACNGDNLPGTPAGYPNYPGYGANYTAGKTGPVTYAGSLIPNSAISSYLKPSSFGFVTLDWDRLAKDGQYAKYHDNAPVSGASNTGASGGFIGEKTYGLFAELNGVATLADNDLHYNAGMRWVRTQQTIGGMVSIADPRNTPASLPAGQTQIADGSRYPNITNQTYIDSEYDNWLPSASASYNVSEHAVVRASVSRTMTRPDPNAQLPGLNFSTPSADAGTVGNSALKPYISDNIDLGFEYYTGGEGYVGFATFRKSVEGFTKPDLVVVPFGALATYGVTYDTLTDAQKRAIDARGGPTGATVVLQQQVNASGKLTVNGLEANWVQPLDFLLGDIGLKGFGFVANGTIIDQKGEGAAPATALGVAKYTYNLVGYYERGGVMVRVSTTYTKGSQQSGTNQNGIPNAAIFSDDYRQYDFSSSFDLDQILKRKGLPQLTFDVVNFTGAKQRSYFQFPNATFTSYDPGRTIMVGLRGRF